MLTFRIQIRFAVRLRVALNLAQVSRSKTTRENEQYLLEHLVFG